MSILINGMEMPKGFTEVRIYADGRVVSQSFSKFGEQIATAIPVPPHGDLIDRNKLLTNEYIPYGKDYTVVMPSDIRNAPTIIPAEKGYIE